ncbi:MAG: hypothetical protein ACRBBO_04025 [Cognatishimia sp.]
MLRRMIVWAIIAKRMSRQMRMIMGTILWPTITRMIKTALNTNVVISCHAKLSI